MILASFAIEEGRENVGEKNLAGALEVAFGAVEAVRHHAEIHVFSAEQVADLAQHFVDANIGAGVARAVIAGEEESEFFTGRPLFAASQHPLQAGELDENTDPGD